MLKQNKECKFLQTSQLSNIRISASDLSNLLRQYRYPLNAALSSGRESGDGRADQPEATNCDHCRRATLELRTNPIARTANESKRRDVRTGRESTRESVSGARQRAERFFTTARHAETLHLQKESSLPCEYGLTANCAAC